VAKYVLAKDEMGVRPVIRRGAMSDDMAIPDRSKIMYYVYILQLNNGNLYTGSTQDLKRRIKEHQRKKVSSTKHKLPLKLILYEGYILKTDAQRRERFLKTTEGKRFLKQQIRDYLRQNDLLQ